MKNNNPKVSVIIPTYNRANLLPRAIESVLKQTFKDFELIIVDDGSTDNTKEIVNNYIKKDNRIKYIYQENSGGPAKPKNTGIKIAKGKYIAFLDSDDEWFINKLKKQYHLYEDNKNNNVGLIGCEAISINNETKEKKYIKSIKYIEARSPEVLKKTIPKSFSSVMINKNVFKEIGLIDEKIKICDDFELYIRISRKYNFLFIQEPLFNYYVHENNVSASKNYIKIIKERKLIMQKHKKIFLSHPNIYSNQFKKFGTFYLLNDNHKLAKKNFIQAIKIKPFSIIYKPNTIL